jgi:DNA-binding NarL/FixJ family response regulator
VKAVLAKLGAANRLEAVVVAQRAGLIHGPGS